MLPCPKVRSLKLTDRQPRSLKYLFSGIGTLYLWLIDVYAKALSPLTVLFFVGWIEWVTWTNDPTGETIRHLGQWGALVAASVVIIGAMVGYYFSSSSASSSSHGPQQAIPMSTLNTTSERTHTSL